MTPITENFRESLRYEYDITPESHVIDIGGYHGQWTKEIVRRYDCYVDVFEPVFWRECYQALKDLPKVTLIPVAAGAQNDMIPFGVQGDKTGWFNGEKQVTVPVLNFADWLRTQGHPTSLLKINAEGMEYEIIDALLKTNMMGRVENLQVQFHELLDWHKARYEELRAELLKTHELTYDFPFCWQNFALKK